MRCKKNVFFRLHLPQRKTIVVKHMVNAFDYSKAPKTYRGSEVSAHFGDASNQKLCLTFSKGKNAEPSAFLDKFLHYCSQVISIQISEKPTTVSYTERFLTSIAADEDEGTFEMRTRFQSH